MDDVQQRVRELHDAAINAWAVSNDSVEKIRLWRLVVFLTEWQQNGAPPPVPTPDEKLVAARKALADVLQSAFPSSNDLGMLVDFYLAQHARAVISHGTLTAQVQELINWVEKAGGSYGERLLAGMKSERPMRSDILSVWRQLHQAGWCNVPGPAAIPAPAYVPPVVPPPPPRRIQLPARSTEINGQDRARLCAILVSIFTESESLDLLVQRLYLPTDSIAPTLANTIGSGSLNYLVFKLLQWAQSTGRMRQLISAALDMAPNDRALADFAIEFGFARL